ncbi:hypothetical protein CDG81_19635 [Actinopolyspora erythraea]|uniref:DUF4232 domain-containing protein n=1 Tax=Actinopolyspora erythraea TaxID=414996 RepID=A0A099D9W5_9ACTN|nr:hypothetical protein [Actinopolyspora erythraea]ASU80108.1 hypothetical protein CDG81_19635 [Actinopolyspora erythraea]KGI82160.1 hypothetical protein IL38_05255 [Actinopolyspora erythraea]
MNRSALATGIAAAFLATGTVMGTALGATPGSQQERSTASDTASRSVSSRIPSCAPADLSINITEDPHGGAGQRAFAVRYTAADADTHCLMRGFPTNVRFFQPDGGTAPGISVEAEHTVAEPVTIDATHSGVSYFIEPSIGQRNELGSVSFRTPTGVQRKQVEVSWPDAPVRGAELRVTPVGQA